MKKDILFVLPNLRVGGAEKTLISALHEIDYEKYNVDVFLFQHNGKFMEKLPSQVHLLPKPENFKYFDSSFVSTVIENLIRGKFRLVIDRIRFSLIFKSNEILAVKEQKAWQIIKNNLPKIDKKYDAAISYLERTANYFVIDKVNAKRKLLHMQTDYETAGFSAELDLPYFTKADKIFAASELVKNKMLKFFPDFDDKILVLESIISKKEIDFFSEKQVTDFPNDIFTIVSVGRIVEAKIHELGVEVMKILKERHLSFNWVIVGDGDRRSFIEQKITEYDLQNYITILGEKVNPYPYVKKADLFLHLSKIEGSAVTVSEAKCLKKCVVLNDFNIAHDIIKSGENGVVAETNALDIANALEKLILDKDLREKYAEATEFETWRTEDAMNILMKEIQS